MTRIWVRKKVEVASLFRGRSLVDLESIRAQWWNELAKFVARNTELSCSRVRKQTDLSWWNRIRVVVRARDRELDLGLDWAPFGDLESIRAQWWNELAKLVARRIELSCSRVRIRRTSVGEIVYESLFVLEIVNSTSVAQKTKMIRKMIEISVLREWQLSPPTTHQQHSLFWAKREVYFNIRRHEI